MHRFRDIAFDMYNVAIFAFNHRRSGSPGTISVKFCMNTYLQQIYNNVHGGIVIEFQSLERETSLTFALVALIHNTIMHFSHYPLFNMTCD